MLPTAAIHFDKIHDMKRGCSEVYSDLRLGGEQPDLTCFVLVAAIRNSSYHQIV